MHLHAIDFDNSPLIYYLALSVFLIYRLTYHLVSSLANLLSSSKQFSNSNACSKFTVQMIRIES